MNQRTQAPDRGRGAPAPPPPPARRRTTVWIVTVIVLVVVAVGVITFATTRGGDSDGDASGAGASTVVAGQPVVQAPVTVDGTVLAVKPDSGSDPAVGQLVPELSGVSTIDGSPITIAAAGKPKLIFVVAHWCPHCQKEVPLIQQWIDDGQVPDGIDLYAVSTAVRPENGNYPPATWLAKEHWSVPTIADSSDNAAMEALGVSGFPFIVAVDADGKVVARVSGEQPVEALDALAARLTS
jgi:cytochrome c biogenesis protein CcmG/thiol:disulfide interchange protein DsbE